MKLKGLDMLWYTEDAEGNIKSIAYCTNSTLEFSSETSTTSMTKDDFGPSDEEGEAVGYTDAELKSKSWSGTSDSLFSLEGDDTKGNSFDDLFDIYDQGKKINVVFGKKAKVEGGLGTDGWNRGNWNFSGKVLVTSLTLNAPVGDQSTYSVSFTGCGKVTHNK